jgi:DeoR family fructose operon transcriptional repressor
MATVDDWAIRPLADLYVDVAFLGTNGCSVERGLTTPDPGEAAVKRAMIAAARRAVLLADHTKIGNDYLARFGVLSDLDLLITDTGLNDDLVEDVEAAGVRVFRA